MPGASDIGIFGGTFDPVHNGHLALARFVADALSLPRLVFMPTGNPHFKLDQQVTPAAQRVRMLELALEGDGRFVLDRREVSRPGVTYTVDTLHELQRENEGARLNFIIGADSALTLVHWRRAAELAALARFVVAPRPGVDADEVRRAHEASGLGFDLLFVDAPQVAVSSSEVRSRCAAGQAIEGLVPGAVAAYIREAGLYRPCRQVEESGNEVVR